MGRAVICVTIQQLRFKYSGGNYYLLQVIVCVAKMNKKSWFVLGALLFSGAVFLTYKFLDVLLFSVFVYYISRPIYAILHKYFGHPSISSFITMLCVITPFLFAFVYTFYIATKELIAFLNVYGSIPIINTILTEFNSMDKIMAVLQQQELIDMVTVNSSAIFKVLSGLLATIPMFLLKVFLVFSLTYYMQKDGSKLISYVLKQLPKSDSLVAERLFREIDRNLFYLFFGSIANAFLTSVIAYISFTTLNSIAPAGLAVPYVALISILMGLASLIPMLGLKLVWIPMYIYLVAMSLVIGITSEIAIYLTIAFLVINFVIDAIPDLVIRPYIAARRVHAGLLLFGYILGPVVLGLVGFFLGPILVIIITSYFRTVVPALKNRSSA